MSRGKESDTTHRVVRYTTSGKPIIYCNKVKIPVIGKFTSIGVLCPLCDS